MMQLCMQLSAKRPRPPLYCRSSVQATKCHFHVGQNVPLLQFFHIEYFISSHCHKNPPEIESFWLKNINHQELTSYNSYLFFCQESGFARKYINAFTYNLFTRLKSIVMHFFADASAQSAYNGTVASAIRIF